MINELEKILKAINNECKNITLKQAFNNFMINAKLTTRIDTQKYYLKCWKKLENIFNELRLNTTNDITKITYKHIELELKNNNYKNNTINKHTDVLKMVIKYNHDMEYIENNKLLGLKKLPIELPNIEIIKPNNKEKIFNYINNLDLNEKNNLRNVIVLRLFAESGIRLNELLHIKVKNLYIEDNEILLEYTKTKQKRYIYFSETTKLLISKYMIVRNQENQYLFTSNNHSVMCKDGIYKFLNKIKKGLEINQSISCHKWRHTFATYLLDKNLNINQVKELLGHTELTTTKRYLHDDRKETKKDLLKVL